MKRLFILVTGIAITAAINTEAQAQLFPSNDVIDALAAAFDGEPTAEKSHKGKIGYAFIQTFKPDWPVKNDDVKSTHDLDPTKDTDNDGIPDIDDDDMDGDGIPDHQDNDKDGDGVPDRKDNHPYDPDKKWCGNDPDWDGDGIPNEEDMFPNDPTQSITISEYEEMVSLVSEMFGEEAAQDFVNTTSERR